jgi:hypothetical protein
MRPARSFVFEYLIAPWLSSQIGMGEDRFRPNVLSSFRIHTAILTAKYKAASSVSVLDVKI